MIAAEHGFIVHLTTRSGAHRGWYRHEFPHVVDLERADRFAALPDAERAAAHLGELSDSCRSEVWSLGLAQAQGVRAATFAPGSQRAPHAAAAPVPQPTAAAIPAAAHQAASGAAARSAPLPMPPAPPQRRSSWPQLHSTGGLRKQGTCDDCGRDVTLPFVREGKARCPKCHHRWLDAQRQALGVVPA